MDVTGIKGATDIKSKARSGQAAVSLRDRMNISESQSRPRQDRKWS